MAPSANTHSFLQTSSKSYNLRPILVFSSICLSFFLCGLDTTAVSIAEPAIVHDLGGDGFAWISASYALTSTAFLPLCPGLIEIFGYQAAMIASLVVFALGSILCGLSRSMTCLIAGRAVQGLGAVGLQVVPNIILSVLVPISGRGTYQGILGLMWSLAGALAPLLAGALSSRGLWRWYFYINAPLCTVALIPMFLLRISPPPTSSREKIRRIDLIGTSIFIASTTLTVVGFTWGGVSYSWSSPQVTVSLLCGVFGYIIFIMYEFTLARDPLVPCNSLRNRTSVSGYLQAFVDRLANVTMRFYLPLYFEACKNTSTLTASFYTSAVTVLIAPASALAGYVVSKTDSYRPQLWTAWVFYLCGTGCLVTAGKESPVALSILASAMQFISSGVISSTSYFPTLTPLPTSENASALAFHAFARSFAAVWGVSIGNLIIQNQLSMHLPTEVLDDILHGNNHVSANIDLSSASLSLLPTLSDPLQREVREAFGSSCSALWLMVMGILGVGLISSLMMQDFPTDREVVASNAKEQTSSFQVGQLAEDPFNDSQSTLVTRKETV